MEKGPRATPNNRRLAGLGLRAHVTESKPGLRIRWNLLPLALVAERNLNPLPQGYEHARVGCGGWELVRPGVRLAKVTVSVLPAATVRADRLAVGGSTPLRLMR